MAHGEGRAEFDLGIDLDGLAGRGTVAMQYVEADGTQPDAERFGQIARAHWAIEDADARIGR